MPAFLSSARRDFHPAGGEKRGELVRSDESRELSGRGGRDVGGFPSHREFLAVGGSAVYCVGAKGAMPGTSWEMDGTDVIGRQSVAYQGFADPASPQTEQELCRFLSDDRMAERLAGAVAAVFCESFYGCFRRFASLV